MSQTATITTQARAEIPNDPSSISTVLADYDIHHSGPGRSTEAALGAAAAHQNPPGWDVTHRRVPPYRPINRHLDQSQRAVFQNNGERAFITVLFTGVVINSVGQIPGTLWNFWRALY